MNKYSLLFSLNHCREKYAVVRPHRHRLISGSGLQDIWLKKLEKSKNLLVKYNLSSDEL